MEESPLISGFSDLQEENNLEARTAKKKLQATKNYSKETQLKIQR